MVKPPAGYMHSVSRQSVIVSNSIKEWILYFFISLLKTKFILTNTHPLTHTHTYTHSLQTFDANIYTWSFIICILFNRNSIILHTYNTYECPRPFNHMRNSYVLKKIWIWIGCAAAYLACMWMCWACIFGLRQFCICVRARAQHARDCFGLRLRIAGHRSWNIGSVLFYVGFVLRCVALCVSSSVCISLIIRYYTAYMHGI